MFAVQHFHFPMRYAPADAMPRAQEIHPGTDCMPRRAVPIVLAGSVSPACGVCFRLKWASRGPGRAPAATRLLPPHSNNDATGRRERYYIGGPRPQA
ncbi:hypothetical protein NDU88_010824 [Pleurodeles waltl]|uniref:Uncharacterized protein n=1 Tax=Pleurodeles waltl TaxID=8319 RepID=A0AAV7QVT1_PLEWA|nr:hypothetical protein NDU88_010824 [Pleurodeles waltl]